jgi:predicted MPP superfamily phosphohydrolase
MILGSWAFWLEPASLRTNVYVTTPTSWPKACDGLSIAVLADLHAGAPFIGLEQIERVVEETNATGPDLILLVGDYVIQGVVGGDFIAPERVAAILSGLRARLGVYAVLGNHDWWLDPGRVRRAITGNGMALLEDASVPLELNGCTFTLVGISDFWEGPHDVRKAFSGLRPGSPIIAFTHNPDVFPQLPMPVSLAIAGHTHGGQVNLPGLGRLIVPSRYGERFAAGVIKEAGQNYFVSTGIGTSILPVRFRVPPEIAVVKIRTR